MSEKTCPANTAGIAQVFFIAAAEKLLAPIKSAENADNILIGYVPLHIKTIIAADNISVLCDLNNSVKREMVISAVKRNIIFF